MKSISREFAEEPEQRCHPVDEACIVRHEKIRLGVLGGSLLALLISFVLFLTTQNVLPLFATIVLVFLFYRYLDATFERAERSPLHPNAYDHPGHIQT